MTPRMKYHLHDDIESKTSTIILNPSSATSSIINPYNEYCLSTTKNSFINTGIRSSFKS